MRPSDEAPSDFQEYTLVSVAAVAAYLGQYSLGERHGLPALAARYLQDANSLEQVFEYIIASVNNYRETYMRMQQLQAAGALDEEGRALYERSPREPAVGRGRGSHHPTAGLMTAMSDLDGFTAKLNAILQADLTAAALAAGPLAEISAVPGFTDGSPESEAMNKSVRSLQEQIALLDRVQNIRVKNIQEEYQRYMERVRSKAQSAIDQANTAYSQHRNGLLQKCEQLMSYMQQQQVLSQQQQQAAAAAAAAAAVAGQRGLSAAGKAGDGGGAVNNPNQVQMVSHSMASQIMALQANMAAAAQAAALQAVGVGGKGGNDGGGSGASSNALAAAVAAAAAAGAHQQQFPFSQILGGGGGGGALSEHDMKVQMEQLEAFAKQQQQSGGGGGAPSLEQMAMLQAAMTQQAMAVAAQQQQQQQLRGAVAPQLMAQANGPSQVRI